MPEQQGDAGLLNQKCDDELLIRWFQDHWKDMKFLSPKLEFALRTDRPARIQQLIGGLNPDRLLHTQKTAVKELWKLLVGSAIIFLKSCDVREKFHDDADYGLATLDEYFDAFCKFESLLYGSNDQYRDHLSHMFKVFLLGEMLLHNLRTEEPFGQLDIGEGRLRTDADEKEPVLSVRPEEKEAMWCVASLTHDLGYPVQVRRDIDGKVRSMLQWFNVESIAFGLSGQSAGFNEWIVRVVSSALECTQTADSETEPRFVTHVRAKYMWKLLRSLEGCDHGLTSAILLFKCLVYFMETDYCVDEHSPLSRYDAKQFLIRQGILRAVATHNCDYFYHLRLFDLATFLRMVDEMQEWERVSLYDLFEKLPRVAVFVNRCSSQLLDYTIEFGPPETTGLQPDDKKAMKDATLQYFAKKCHTYLELLRSGVDGLSRGFELTFHVKWRDPADQPELTSYTMNHKTPAEVLFKKNDVEVQASTLIGESRES